ncbi:hypothetical protein ACFV3E_43660 [Streptomyces sp. NPDC059718]
MPKNQTNESVTADGQEPEKGALENLFDAPADDSDPTAGDNPFTSWAAAPTPVASPPATPRRPRAVPRQVPDPEPEAEPQPQYIPDADAEGALPRNGQVGFRLSQEVADLLKAFRQAQDLTVTEVVIMALDHIADEIPDVMERAKMPARVQPRRSRFAPRGEQGPLKGTGPIQRWWQPTRDDMRVLRQMAAEASVRDKPGVLIAVALNEFLPGTAMNIAGDLRRKLQEDASYAIPGEVALTRTFEVSREVARQAVTQLQVEGIVPASDS